MKRISALMLAMAVCGMPAMPSYAGMTGRIVVAGHGPELPVMQDLGRAKLVGKSTLGNVEILHGYSFDDGSRVWIAEERFDPLVSHAHWEGNGIHPDVQAYADWDTFTFETDPAIAAALALWGKK